jgi:hypothetical protein
MMISIKKRTNNLVLRIVFVALTILLNSTYISVANNVKTQTPSSLVYFHPFAKNLSEIRIHTTATDTEGCVYLAGSINDTPRIAFFPIGGDIPGFSREYNGGSSDAFVMKLDPSGTKLLFSTFIGGSDFDEIASIHVNDSGMVYLAGRTHSRPEDGFPIGGDIPGLQRTSPGMIDGFLMILDPSGTKVLYSSYIGGGSSEDIGGLALDAEGNIYLSGKTLSTEKDAFPIGGSIPGYDPTFNGELYDIVGEPAFDAFVMKLDPTGMKVLYSTYLGGKGYNWTNGLKVDSLGRAHVIGSLGKLSTPDSQAGIRSMLWEHDYEKEEFANYVILDPKGSTIEYSAQLPFSQSSLISNHQILITGEATHNILSQWNIHEGVSGLTQQFKGSQDIFSALLDTTNKKLLSATFLGGKDLQLIDHGVDSKGQVYLLGYTKDSTSLAWDSEYISVTEGLHYLPGSCFLVKLDPKLEKILYASHFESPDRDSKYFGLNMCVDEHEQAYIAGHMPETTKDYSFVMKVDTTIDARASEKTNQDPVMKDAQKSIPSSPQVMFWLIFLILLLLLVLGWIRVRSKGKKE